MCLRQGWGQICCDPSRPTSRSNMPLVYLDLRNSHVVFVTVTDSSRRVCIRASGERAPSPPVTKTATTKHSSQISIYEGGGQIRWLEKTCGHLSPS